MTTPEEVQNATAAQHWQDAANSMQQEIAGLRGRADESQAATRQTSQTSLIDTRVLGKVDSFDGGAAWKDWSNVFRS